MFLNAVVEYTLHKYGMYGYGHGRADKVRNWLGIKSGLGAEYSRQDKQRSEIYKLPPKGQGKREPHLADGRKPVYNFILKPQRQKGQRAYPNGPKGAAGDRGVICEQPYKPGAAQLGHGSHKSVVGKTENENFPLSLLHSGDVAGAVVVA